MKRKVFILIFCLVLAVATWLYPKQEIHIFSSSGHACISYMPCEVCEEAKKVSYELNEAMKMVGMMACKIADMEKKGYVDVSSRGGWCSNISGKNSTQHMTDRELAKFLSAFFKNRRVASFGDGPGMYKRLITEMGEVATYDAYDGAPFAENTTDGDVKHLDLSVPIYHLPLYDWVISLEVAEHIPVDYEQTFIDNLTRHAKIGIVLSWSRLGQGGHSHVNNRNISYVVEQLEKRGFALNMEKSNLLKEAARFGWLKLNTYIYYRINKL